jgi:hypothetical protein
MHCIVLKEAGVIEFLLKRIKVSLVSQYVECDEVLYPVPGLIALLWRLDFKRPVCARSGRWELFTNLYRCEGHNGEVALRVSVPTKEVC